MGAVAPVRGRLAAPYAKTRCPTWRAALTAIYPWTRCLISVSLGKTGAVRSSMGILPAICLTFVCDSSRLEVVAASAPCFEVKQSRYAYPIDDGSKRGCCLECRRARPDRLADMQSYPRESRKVSLDNIWCVV